jgi:ribosomal protein S18 acetylase RimI-like enzyme
MSQSLEVDLPAGLSARPARYGDDGVVERSDVDAVVALINGSDERSFGEALTRRGEVEEMFSAPSTDRSATLLVADGERVVGFAWVEFDDTGLQSWIDPYVDPADPVLLEALVRYGRAVAARHRQGQPDEPWTLRAGCDAREAEIATMYERVGMRRVRRFHRMRLDLTTAVLPPRPAALPDGVEILDAYDGELRRLAHTVVEDAFVGHWEHVRRTYEEWDALMRLAPGDPTGWWLATVDGEPAAVCLLDDRHADIQEGYVRTLGVRAPFRGRGLARGLLLRAFGYYRDRGMVGVQLGVDSQNETGATELYESVGMAPERVIDAYSLAV